MSSFYWYLFPPFFFPLLSAHPSLVRSFAKIRTRVFTANITKKASPCNNTTVNTKDGSDFFLRHSYGVSFCHTSPSLKASSPLKRNVWKKNYICAATYIQFDNIDVKSYAVGSFNNGSSSLKSARVNWFFTLLVKLTLESNLSSLPFIRWIFGVMI